MTLAIASSARPGLLPRLAAAVEAGLAAQNERLAPWLTVALGAGVLAYFARLTEPGPAALWLPVPLVLLALIIARRHAFLGWAAGLVAAFALGFALVAWHASRLPPPLDLPGQAVMTAGTVLSVESLPEGRRVTLGSPSIADGPPQPRTIRLRLRADDASRPLPGDRLEVRALLRAPGAPVAPGGWDFQRAAYFSGLGSYGFALGPAKVTPGTGEAPPLAALRTMLEERVAAAIPGPAGAIASALLTGSQSAIPPAEMAAMRDSGLAHLLSVSGLHMTIVMGVVFATARLLLALIPWIALRLPGKQLAAMAALVAGGFYMLLTGAQVPMQRCLAMATLVTIALLAGRRALSLRAVAIAAAVVIMAAPAELLGPSFQMSFAAVLALVAGHEALRPHLAAFRAAGGAWRRAVLLVGGLVVTSALAGAATAPIGLHHFGQLQIYGIAANGLAVPLTSLLVMPAGMVGLLLMPLGWEAMPLGAMGLGVEGILQIAHAVAAWPGAAPALAPPPGWVLALAAFGFCWLCLWRGRPRLLGLPILAGALAGGMLTAPPDLLVSADGRLVALRTRAGVFLHQLPGATAFARQTLLRQLGATSSAELPARGEAADGAIICTPQACRFRPRPDAAEAVLFRTSPPQRGARRGEPPDAAVLAEACGSAALLVATEPIRPGCAGSAVIDRFTLWREGAHAAWLRPASAVLRSDRATRGERPWVPPLPLPGRPETLPLAPLDPGIPSHVGASMKPSQ